MANGGEAGANVERIEHQVEAARSELASVAGTVNGLVELVHDLVRRGSSNAEGHQEERWQARLGSLETRLEMLETNIRSEVDRMRATAGAVDAMADEFRTTVGGTRNLVELAGDIGDRIGALNTLERQVRGAAQDVADAVDQRLDQDSASRDARDAALADRYESVVARMDELLAARREQAQERARLDAIERAVGETRQIVDAVARHVDTVAASTNELPSMEERLSGQVREATAWGDVLGRLSTQVGAVHGRLDDATSTQRATGEALTAMRAEVAQLNARVEDSSGTTQLAMADAITALRADVSGLAERMEEEALGAQQTLNEMLGRVAGELGTIRARIADSATASSGAASAATEGLRADLAALQSQLGEVVTATTSGAADTMADAMAGVTTQMAGVTAEVAAIRGRLGEVVTATTSGVADTVATALADVTTQAASVAAEVTAMRGRLEETTVATRQTLADAITGVAAELTTLRARFDDTNAVTRDGLADALGVITAEVAGLRGQFDRLSTANEQTLVESFSAVAAELTRLHERVGETTAMEQNIAAVVGEVRQATREDASVAAAADARLSELLDAVVHLQSMQPQVTVRLDQLAADIADFPMATPDIGPALAPVAARLDELATRIDAATATTAGALAGQPDHREHIEHLASEIAALRAAQPDGSELSNAIGAMVHDVAGRVDRLAAEVLATRANEPDIAASLGPMHDRIDALTVALQQLGTITVPDPGPQLDQLTVAISSVFDDVARRVDRLSAEVAASRAAVPDIAASLGPMHERIDALTAAMPRLADITVPDNAPHIEALAAAVDATRTDLAASLTPIHERIDALTAHVQQLGAISVPDNAPHIEALAAAVEATRTDLAASLTPVHERIDALTAAMARLADVTVPDARPQISELSMGVTTQLGAMSDRLAEVAAAVEANRLPPLDLPGLMAPVLARLDMVSALVEEQQPAVVVDPSPQIEAVAADLQTRLHELSDRLDRATNNLTADLAAFRPVEPDVAGAVNSALVPVQDALARTNAQVEAIATMVTSAASSEAVAGVHDAVTRTNAQVERVTEAVAALHNAGDDADRGLTPVVDRLAVVLDGVSSLHSTIGELADSLASVRADRAQLAQTATATNDRLDSMTALIGELRTNRPDLTSSLQAIGGVVEAVQGAITDTHDRIDVLGELVRQAAEPRDTITPLLVPVNQRLDALAARVAASEQRFEDVLAGIALAVDQIEQAATANDQRAARLDVIGSELTSLRNEVAPALAPRPERPDRAGEVLDAISGLAAVDAELRALVHGLAADMGIVRQDFDPTEGYRVIGGAIQDLRTDLQGTRTDLLSLAHSVSDLRAEARRTESDLGGGAAAALVASAASAMARLEARIDGEFDSVSRQMEALGTLLGQSIEAVHRVESQVVGVQPVSEKMRTAAASVLDTLRANVRQRSNRHPGPPPELGAGGAGHDAY